MCHCVCGGVYGFNGRESYTDNTSQFADLDSELTEKSCAVLYELIQVTQQARWPLAKKTSVSPMWLVETLASDTAVVSLS